MMNPRTKRVRFRGSFSLGFFAVSSVFLLVFTIGLEGRVGSQERVGKGRIVFSSYQSGNWELWTVQADGSGLEQISRDNEEKHQPAVAPDGSTIAYVNNLGHIKFWQGTGTAKLLGLPPNCNYPRWSPDGKKIVFVSFSFEGDQEDSDIWLLDLEDKRSFRLFKQGGIQKDPVFVPDGSAIVYTLAYRGREGRIIEDIWKVKADGTEPERLISNGVRNIQPDISADGRWMAFASDLTGNMEIWIARLDGTGQRQLTQSEPYDAQPVWSPDGSTITFASTRSGKMDIWMMDRKGKTVRQLTGFSSKTDSKDPTWARTLFGE